MSSSDQRTPQEAPTPSYIETEIARDHSFVHIAADSAIVSDLGHDFEVAFLRNCPRPIATRTNRNDDERMQLKFKAETLEVARLRIAPAVALQMAMLALDKLIEEDHIDTNALMEHLQAKVAKATESESEGNLE